MFVVLFEVLPAPGEKDAYLGYARELKPRLEAIDGFIDNERFDNRSREGWVLSLSTWRDEKAVIRWRTEARHHLVQEKGRVEVFADYHLRVGEVTDDSHPPVPLREQRFDTTAVGRATHTTIVELTPSQGTDLPFSDGDLQRAVGLDPGPSGPDTTELFASIYNPGKVLLLAGWTDAASAAGFRQTVPAPGARRRGVRIIRDYGMADRRESPQYYPDLGQGSKAG